MSYEEETTDLRARIRELEAELAKAWSEADKFANRAEETIQENEILTRTVFSQSARAEKAEARVAELETWRKSVATALPHTQKAMLFELAREREAE